MIRERLGLFSYAILFFVLPGFDILGEGRIVDLDLFFWVSVVSIFSPLLNLNYYARNWCYWGYNMSDIYVLSCMASTFVSCILIAVYPPSVILVWGYWIGNIVHYPFWQYISETEDFASEKWMVFAFLASLVIASLYMCVNGELFLGLFATGLVMGLLFFGFLLTKGNPEII